MTSPSVYLQSSDYATYGVPNATTAQVNQSSALIDGYLCRSEGLIYTLDQNNNPIAMAATGQPISYYLTSPLRGSVIVPNIPLVALSSVQYNNQQGLPPIWVTATNSKFTVDGHVWLDPVIPSNIDILIQYVSGWLYTNLPSNIKQACANIVTMLQEGFFSGNIERLRAGDTEISFSSSKTGLIDESTKSLLSPYRKAFA